MEQMNKREPQQARYLLFQNIHCPESRMFQLDFSVKQGLGGLTTKAKIRMFFFENSFCQKPFQH